MSRSRKKHPVIKDNRRGSKKFWKRLSNNILKQHDVANGCAYKRLLNGYFFCDYWYSLLGTTGREWWYNYDGCRSFEEDLFNLTRK